MLVPAPVPVEIMARAWHDIVREDADNSALQAALRNLVRNMGLELFKRTEDLRAEIIDCQPLTAAQLCQMRCRLLQDCCDVSF